MRMTETTKNSSEKLSVTPTKTLTLKRGGVEQGVVRQSFSHGRSKAVVVEKVKRRVSGPGEAKAEPVTTPDRGAVRAPAKTSIGAGAPATATPAATPKASGVVLRTLTDDERNARAHALADARLRETEERERAEERSEERRVGKECRSR